MSRLVFKPMTDHPRGTIVALLVQSYQGTHSFAPWLSRLREEWKEYDDQIFDHPKTVGTAGFVSYRRRSIVGFATWDPRNHPVAIVGHNCILPEFRKQGFGKMQMEEVLQRLRTLKFTKVCVTTGDHPFFLPARKMYLACGFRETRRTTPSLDRDSGTIEMERNLYPR